MSPVNCFVYRFVYVLLTDFLRFPIAAEASFGDIAKIISTQFKALPEGERKKWDAKAATDKERYVAQMADYQTTL